jgi:hypothetical protein
MMQIHQLEKAYDPGVASRSGAERPARPGHLAGAVVFGGYVPGAATAPFLVVAGIGLLRALGRAAPKAGPSCQDVSP